MKGRGRCPGETLIGEQSYLSTRFADSTKAAVMFKAEGREAATVSRESYAIIARRHARSRWEGVANLNQPTLSREL